MSAFSPYFGSICRTKHVRQNSRPNRSSQTKKGSKVKKNFWFDRFVLNQKFLSIINLVESRLQIEPKIIFKLPHPKMSYKVALAKPKMSHEIFAIFYPTFGFKIAIFGQFLANLLSQFWFG